MVSAEKLLEKYLGKDVAIQLKARAPNRTAEHAAGRCSHPIYQSIVVQTGDGVRVILRSEVQSICLAKQDASLITKPTLVWKITTEKAGKHDAQVTYQTDGLTWRADYNVIVNKNDTPPTSARG